MTLVSSHLLDRSSHSMVTIESTHCAVNCADIPHRQTLVFEAFLKLGKLQCKSYFNKNEVLLMTIDNFETNQIVLYLRGGYMMHLETTCHVSHVTCHMTHVTCHMSFFFFFYLKKNGQSGGASRWRVCYQQGLPHLVKPQNHRRKYGRHKTRWGRLITDPPPTSFTILSKKIKMTHDT